MDIAKICINKMVYSVNTILAWEQAYFPQIVHFSFRVAVKMRRVVLECQQFKQIKTFFVIEILRATEYMYAHTSLSSVIVGKKKIIAVQICIICLFVCLFVPNYCVKIK